MAYNLVEENKVVYVEIHSPLLECLRHCEINCVAGCCGVDAFSSDEKDIVAWAETVTVSQLHIALGQLQALVKIAEDQNYIISSTYINAHTASDAAKREFLDFLRKFECSLRKVAQENPL